MQTQSTDFWKLFKPKACVLALEGQSREAVFREIVGTLVKAGQLEEERLEPAVETLLRREQTASTGVGRNVAVPHVKLAGLERAVTSLSVHPAGVDWEALDGEPVHLLFTVLRPDTAGEQHDPKRHLEMMRWISRLSRAADFRRFALQCSTRTELVDLLKEMSAV